MPVVWREEIEKEMNEIQGFREYGRSGRDAGKRCPSWDAGMAPQGGRGQAKSDRTSPPGATPSGLSQAEAFGNSPALLVRALE